VDNHKFRTTLNPKHHTQWQKDNAKRVCEIVRKHRAADKIRWGEHKIHYRLAKQNRRNRLPLLHESFDKWGVDNHKIETIIELEGISRKDLRELEKVFIKSFKEKASILNTYN